MEKDKLIKELYDELLYFPNQVFEILCDYYGEERVDIDLLSLSAFTEHIEALQYKYFYLHSAVSDFNLSAEEIVTLNTVLVEYESIKFNYILDDIETLSKIKNIIIYRLREHFSCGVLIHFPEVRITNERDRYVDVKNLWAKFSISYDGKLKTSFSINRSEYQKSHLVSDYQHSHTCGLPSSPTEFREPCFGSGPILRTMRTLRNNFNINIWNLFCLELDRYMATESIEGIPYRYLEKISIEKIGRAFACNLRYQKIPEIVKEFIPYLINSKELIFIFNSEIYTLGMSYYDVVFTISNLFIKWFNDKKIKKETNLSYSDLLNQNTIISAIAQKGNIYSLGKYSESNRYVKDTPLFSFKGKTIKLDIIEDATNSNPKILNPSIIDGILYSLVTTINYIYGREDQTFGISTPTREVHNPNPQ